MPKIKRSTLQKIIEEEVQRASNEAFSEGIFGKSKLDKEMDKIKADPHALNVGKRVKPTKGKISSSEMLNNRLRAAGLDPKSAYAKKVKELVHGFF